MTWLSVGEPAHLAAVAPQILDEDLGDPLGDPAELGEAGRDLAVELVQVLREEAALCWRERAEYTVVVSHHEHDVLAQAAVALAVGSDLHGRVRDLEVQPLPVVHLAQRWAVGSGAPGAEMQWWAGSSVQW